MYTIQPIQARQALTLSLKHSIIHSENTRSGLNEWRHALKILRCYHTKKLERSRESDSLYKEITQNLIILIRLQDKIQDRLDYLLTLSDCNMYECNLANKGYAEIIKIEKETYKAKLLLDDV